MKLRAWFLDPPHRAVGEGGLEYFRIIVELNRQSCRFLFAKQIVKGGSKRQPRRLLEHKRHAVLVARERNQDFAMTVRELGKIMRLRQAEVFERLQGFLQRCNQPRGAIKFLIFEPSPWLGIVQRGRFAISKLFELAAEARKITCEA